MPLVSAPIVAGWWTITLFATVIPVAVVVTMVLVAVMMGRLPVLNRWLPHYHRCRRVDAGLVNRVCRVHRVRRRGVTPGDTGADQATRSGAHQCCVVATDRLANGRTGSGTHAGAQYRVKLVGTAGGRQRGQKAGQQCQTSPLAAQQGGQR